MVPKVSIEFSKLIARKPNTLMGNGPTICQESDPLLRISVEDKAVVPLWPPTTRYVYSKSMLILK